jgi:DNA-directed RNA polymerase sigma subunit (sigma70/sigma32)
MGILDTIIDTKRTDLVNEFEPIVTVGKILDQLKERDREILARRYGLSGFSEQTLEAIGKDLKLTRERVRQIEKALLKNLQASPRRCASSQPSASMPSAPTRSTSRSRPSPSLAGI